MDRRHAIAAEVPRLRRYARALVRDATEADDLVHDCVVRALSRLSSWREDVSPRRWLFTILHNLHVDRLRARARRPMHFPLEDVPVAAAGTYRPSEDATLGEIDRALQALPEEQRQCVLLVGLEGLTYGETAEVLGTPVGTVMSRLARGRERLRQLLDRGGERPTLRRVK